MFSSIEAVILLQAGTKGDSIGFGKVKKANNKGGLRPSAVSALWPWISHRVFLNLSFLICKIGMLECKFWTVVKITDNLIKSLALRTNDGGC